MEVTYDGFISYSRKDRAFAQALERALEGYLPPKDLPLDHRHPDLFRDENDFTGTEYRESVQAHLRHSRSLIVICSPDSAVSPFVNDEIRIFSRQGEDPRRVIPVLYRGIPNNEVTSENKGDAAFAAALCELSAVPLGVDYRGFDPKHHKVAKGPYAPAWYMLLANFYGLSRAQVEDRDRKRNTHVRRLRLGLITAVIAALSVALLIAVIQKREADKQRSKAETQTALARHQEEKANFSASEADLQRIEAVRQRDIAEVQRREAVRQREAAVTSFANLLASLAVTYSTQDEAQLPHSILVAVESLSRLPNASAFQFLQNQSSLLPRVAGVLPQDDSDHIGAFSRDGSRMASIKDLKITVWDTAGLKRIQDWQIPGTGDAEIEDVYFTPDGRCLVAARSGNSLRDIAYRFVVLEVGTGREVFGFSYPDFTGVEPVAVFSSDAKKLITKDDRAVCEGSSNALSCVPTSVVSVDPSMAYFGTQSGDGESVSIRQIDGREVGRLFTSRLDQLYYASREIEGPIVSRNGRWMAHQGYLWDLKSRESGVSLNVGSEALAFSSDEAFVALSDEPNIVRLLDLNGNRQEVGRLIQPGRFSSVVFSPDNRYVTAANLDQPSAVWELPPQIRGLTAPVESAFAPLAVSDPVSERYIATATRGYHDIQIQVLRSGKAVRTLTQEAKVLAVSFIPQRSLLVAGGDDGNARVYDVKSGVEVVTLRHGLPVNRILPTADGHVLLTLDSGRTLSLWDVGTWRLIRRLRKMPFSPLAISADGQLLASATNDERLRGQVALWNLNGIRVARARFEGTYIDSCAFSKDGKLLAAMSGSGQVIVWHISEGRLIDQRLFRVVGQNENATAVMFTPDGRYIAVTGNVMTKVVEVATGVPSLDIARFFDPALQAPFWHTEYHNFGADSAFSPDGRYVGTVDAQQNIMSFPLWVPDLIHEACSKVAFNIERIAWPRIFGNEPYHRICSAVPEASHLFRLNAE